MSEGMNKNKLAKREVVNEIKQKIGDAKSFVVIDYKGLSVSEDTDLRNEFRKEKVEYTVLKNTLVRLALNELGYKDFDADLNGPTAVAFAHGDALAPAKIAAANIKKFNKMKLKCGMFDKKYVDQNTAIALSKVPNKETLLAMLLSVLQAPMRSLAATLKAVAER